MGRLFGLGRLMEPWARAHGKRPWSSLAETSVRAHTPVGKRAQTGGKASVIGLRREDKNKWERRAPLAPRHVDELVKQGLKVVVQPCTRRVFTDVEYLEAGAEIKEDLSECSTILAVKEVPPELLLPGRTWCFFSHTIKECITGTGARGGPRLVAFGAFAGYAGAIDFLRGLGERFLSLGYSTPLLHIGSAFMYPTLEEAKRAVSLAGEAIRKHGLPKALCPFTAVFTGTGNVSQGALEIFKLLPHELVSPSTLPQLCEKADSGLMQREDCHKLYLSIATAEHMVKRRDGGAFDKEGYYSQPENYQPTFQDAVLPYATVILNGMYWDARFPKLFTRDDLHRHVEGGRDKLLGVCDITCDADGSVPTRQFASIEQPFHILNAMTGQLSDCLDDPGVLFHAVDHLPSELPRESSEHFGDCLVPFLPYLAEELAPMEPGSTDQLAGSAKMPMPIRGAIIAEGGALTREYRYIQQLRDVRQGKVVAAEDESAAELPAAPSCCTLELTGHLFDSRLINKVADLCEQGRARMHILLLDVGRSVRDESFLSVMVMAHSDKILEAVTHKIQAAAAEASVNFRRAGRSGTTESPTKVEKKVLLLGAGHVASPFVERLLRRPNVALVVASYLKSDFDPLSQIPGASTRLQPEVLDVAAANAGDAAAQSKLDALVAGSDLVVSLLPATLHVGVARLAIRHGVSMVTASYVSPEMKALNDEAEQAGVLILNEVGLDPGIDHLSAMSMIDTARSVGSEIIRFASLCGGLPAPEVAGTNPIGYKFSWSPRGVLVASQNAARWKEDGKLREVAGVDLLAQAKPIIINNSFALDVLPNRDSTLFAELYGLEDIPTFFRGTLRFRGFCERMLVLSRLGLLRLGPVAGLQSFQGTRRRWLAEVLSEVGPAAKEDPSQLYHSVRKQLELAGLHDETGLEFLSWLGLLQDMPLPQAAADCPLDVVAQLLQRPETAYQSGERDMAIMRHELDVRRSDGAQERLVSTLIQYGEPNGHTAMAKTVGLTTAISAELVLDRPKDFGVGVQRPLRAEWYQPILSELEAEGIFLREHVEPLLDLPLTSS